MFAPGRTAAVGIASIKKTQGDQAKAWQQPGQARQAEAQVKEMVRAKVVRASQPDLPTWQTAKAA